MVSTFIGLLDIQSWWEIPCISHFCSLFSSAFDLPDIDIEDLESALLCDGTDYQVGLVPELTVRLLKGIDALKCVANDITTSNYQMFLRRFLRQQCRALNIENHFDTDIDFQSLAVRKRLLILHELCHFRLHSRDVELIFSNLEADSLRVEPLGYDSKNSGYWYFYGTRLYREDTKQNNKTKIWQVICFTEEDWQNLASKFKSATNEKERTLYYILTENFLPKLPQLFREREKLRRKKLLQTRNSSRIRNLVEAKARQEKERAKEERYQRARAEQRLVLEPPRLLTSKSRRRRSQSTSTASGISTYASSIRPPTNSSDFLYQRETFCLTPDDLGADTPSSISPNRIERISEANSKEDYYNSDSENQQDSIEVQSSPPPSPAPPIKKRKSKKSKSSKSSKKSHRNKEARNRSPSITEDKENCGYISETESDSEVCMMPPTTNLKLPGRQTNNSLSSLPGNIFIPPLSDGKEPETSTRKSSNSGKTSTTVKKQKNQKLSVIPSTSSASKERSRSLTTKSDRNGRNKKKSTSKTSTEERQKTSLSNRVEKKPLYNTTSISQRNVLNSKIFNKNSQNFLSFSEKDEFLQIGMHKVLVYLKNHRDAWPFMDPVEEDIAPRYYNIIRRPMDLLKMEDKLDNGEYTKLSEFRNDFKLIVNNCRLYNGLDNGKYAGALEYSDMVNNLHEAFAKATKKFVDHLSDDDDESSNLNYPNTKTKVFREKYRKVENSDSDEESDNSKSLRKKNLRKKESRKDSEDDIDESEDDEGVVDIATPSGSRPTKRKRKDKEKRRKKKSKTRIVEQSSDDDNWSSGEEVQPKRRKETSNGSSGKKTKKRSAKTSSKKNDQHRKKQRRMRGASSRNLGRNNSSDDESEIDDSKKYQKQSVKSNRKGTHINQNSYNLQGDTIKKRKIRTKKTISRSHSKIATKKVKKENDDSDSDDNSDESSSRSRSISPFKVDLHKKYATSTLNDEVNDDEYNETDFKSVSTQSTSRESSVDRSQNNSKDFKPSTSKEHIKKTNIKNKSITGNTLNQTPKKKEKPPEPVKEPPPFLDKYDLIKQRRNRAQTTNEDKTNNNNITKKDTKKAEATITSASSSRSKPSKESDDKPKAKIKEVTEEKPTVKEEKPTVKEEKPTVKEEKPTAKEEKPTVKEKKPSKTPAVEEKKRRVSIEATEPLKEAHDVQETAKPKSSNNRTPKKSGTSSTSKKTPKDPEKPPSGKKKIVLPPSPAPVEQIKSDSSQAQSKSTNLEALELETEQTLKDINRWLEHTPRFPEFSSASNSPTRYTALLDDFDSVSNKLDPTDFRRPIPIATPKIDLVPKFDESLDSFVAEAEVPNNKKDLISDLIPTTCSESVSSCYATPPHSSNSNISAGSISISALSISSSATLLPDIPQKSKEPSTTVLISNPPPPPHIKNQMQKEAKRKSLKEKLSAAVNSRKKDVIGTIDRLKPGKTKGNLIQNVPKQDELANSSLTPLQKVKDVKNALIVDTDDTVPKLSLGSVLDTDGFGLGHSHNFGDKESSDIVDEISDDNLKSIIEEDLRPTEPKKTFSLDAPFEAKKVSNPEPKGDSSSGTPDLSAWLKAFGVPKKTKKSEEEDNKPTSQLKALTCNTETTTSDKCADTGTGTANVLKSPSSSENNFSQPPPRQRKASTGSTISERSSFSQDPDSPRIAIDERYGSYSGNYTSPIGASPIGASPIMVSPKPDEMGKSNSPYPLNGTIKVGFYQDTTTKSSPEKSCSPRELPSPYPQYSQHIYSSTSSPNVSTTEMSGNSPYGANSYAPSAGSDSSKTPAYSSSSPIPNLYEQYKQPHSQESDYNSSMSPSTPNPHSPYQAGANSPYQCSAQSPYQNQSSPYQQQTSTTSQVTQQPAAGSTSLQFPSAIIEQSGTSSSISNTSENPAVESQQQNSPFQQTASSSFQQQQQTSTYATNSVGTNFQSNAGVFPEAVNNTTQQSNESTTLSNNTTAQSAPQISPQSNHRTFDETSQFHGYQQQSCQQQPQQQQQQTQNTTIGTLYSLNKGSDWTISQVSEQFQPPTYSQYTLAAINKELSTQKSEDQFLSQKHQPQNSIVSTLKRHLEGDSDVLKPDYNAKMPKRDDNSQTQQQSNKQPHLYDNFMNAVNYGKQLDVASNKTFEMFNRSANMVFPKDYTSATAVKDPSLQFHQQQQESQQQQSQQNQQQQEQQQHTNSQQQTQQTSVMDNSLINKPINMANSSTYSQQQMHQQVQHHQSQDLYNKSQNSFPTNLSQPSTTAIEKPNESLISHLSLYKTQTYGSPTSMLNINHSTVSNVIDESILGINQNSSSATATTMGGVSYFDKNMPPAAHMNISSAPIYQNLNPYTGHSSTIAREQSQQQQQQQQQIQSNNYGTAITNSTNSVPSSSQSMDIMPLETKTTTKKTRTRKKASNSTTATTGDGTGKNTSAVSQAPLNSTGIQNTQLTPANTQQQMNLHHSQMQNIQGFQLYAGLKSGVNPTTNIPPATSSDASAISLKTTSVAAGSSMVPGSAFNFGPSPATLGLSTAGIYGDNTSYLDQFRDTSNPYYIPTPTHRPATTDSGGTDKPNNGTPASYPFLTHPSTRTPPFNPFVNTPQLDANSPFYQQYLQHQGDFRARMMQGLLAPGGPSAYPQPGAYRPSGIGIPKPYDINRQPWF